MRLATEIHPDLPTLSAFSLGQLSDADSATIEEHVSLCETCRELLEAAPADSLVAMLRDSSESPPATSPLPPTSNERYEILGEIGRGGMGIVFRAHQLGLNRIVALKMLRDGMPIRAEDAARFRAEAEAAARLHHPNIAQIYEVGERDGQPFLAFEYIDGGTLAQHLSGKPVAPQTAAAFIESLAQALDYAHRQGVVHRDLKPANVLVSSGQSAVGRSVGGEQWAVGSKDKDLTMLPTAHCSLPTLKIADFGLAKLLDDPDGPTRTGALLGTPSYMAPEQTTGAAVGPAADIYALGAILYECLTGGPPFRAATTLETLEQVRTNEPVSVRTLQPRTPRDLETICLKCLRKEPAQRYATGADLADDLRRFQQGAAILARPVSGIERLGKWMRRRPAQAALVALAALAIVGIVAGITAHNSRLRVEADRADQEQRRAAEHYRQARDALRRVLSHGAPDAVTPKSRITEVRLRQLEDALVFYRGAASADEKDPEVRHDMAIAHLNAASELTAQSQLDRAEPHMMEGRTLLESLTAAHSESVAYRSTLSACYNNLGYLHSSKERSDRALEFHLKALAIREQLADRDPAYWPALAASCHNVGAAYHLSGRSREAETYYQRAADLWAKVHAQKPDAFTALDLADSLTNLALLTSTPEHIDSANKRYLEIERLLGPHIEDRSAGVRCATSLAGANNNWANLLRSAGQMNEMFARFARSESLLDLAHQREPTWHTSRDMRYNLSGARAQANGALGRHEDALKDWDSAVATAPNDARRRWVSIIRLFTRIHLGDYQTAAKEADELSVEPNLDGTAFYNLACVYSLCIPPVLEDPALINSQRIQRADDYTTQALQCLTSARSAGFFRERTNFDNLRNDNDLKPLHVHPTYQALIRELEKESPRISK